MSNNNITDHMDSINKIENTVNEIIGNGEGRVIPMNQISRLSLDSVKERTSLSRSSIYRKIAKKEFPIPCKDGARSMGVSTDSDRWKLTVISKIKHRNRNHQPNHSLDDVVYL